MEHVSKQLCQLIRGPHSPYRALYNRLVHTYRPVKPLSEDGDEFLLHAPMWIGNGKYGRDRKVGLAVYDWKVSHDYSKTKL